MFNPIVKAIPFGMTSSYIEFFCSGIYDVKNRWYYATFYRATPVARGCPVKRLRQWLGLESMIGRINSTLSDLSGDPESEDPPDAADDRDAGIPVPVRRGPPDRGSSVAVAEPEDDDE